MSEFKKIYSFFVNRLEEVEEEDVIKNEAGEEIKQIKKVKKQIPVEFFIKKPNRILFDEAELYYGIKLAESIKAGMLTRTSMLKKYESEGGIFTKSEEEVINKLMETLKDKQKALAEIEYKEKDEGKELTDQEKQDRDLIEAEARILKNQLIDFENSKTSLFDQTAETRARNKAIVWWILYLAYKKEKDKFFPLFGEGSFNDRLEKYDEIEDQGDEFWQKVLLKLAYLVSFWYSGKIITEEDFKAVEEYYDANTSET